jgi:group I intron endonuclease
VNGKKYIGKSINISKRLGRHCRNVKDGVITKFYNSVRKYGWDNFIFGIIEECDENTLDEKEIFHIQQYKTLNNGYNMTSGGDGGITWIMPEDIRKKYSERMKKFKHTEEGKLKISESNKGRKWSDESKRRLSETLKGKKGPIISQDGKNRISESKKGIKRPQYVIDKIIETKKSKYKPENHISAKKFIFISPIGEEYFVVGGFKRFCDENNISNWGMRNILKTGKIVPGCKNWMVKRSD